MKLVRNLSGHLVVKDTTAKSKMSRKLGLLLSLTLLIAMCITSTAFAAVPGALVSVAATAPAIDSSVFTTIITGAKAVLGLFTEFPINVFLAASILGIAIGVVRKVKSS